MKTTKQFHWATSPGKMLIATTLAITGMTTISSVAHAQAINLGAAETYGVLSLDFPTRMDRTAVLDADAAGIFAEELGYTRGFAARHDFTLVTTYETRDIFTNTTIKLTSDSNYVLDVAAITLANSTLTINAPAGAKVVVDISGAFLVDGGKIVLTGGLQAKNVLFDLTGFGGGVGIVANGTVGGTILAPDRAVLVFGRSVIQGSVIAGEAIVIPPSVVSPEF